MSGSRARELRKIAHKEHPDLARNAAQYYTLQIRLGVQTGAFVCIGERAKYKTLKKEHVRGLCET